MAGKRNLFIATAFGLAVILTLIIGFRHRPTTKISAMDDILKIVNDVHATYANKTSYWGLSTKTFFGNDILTKYRYKENQLINALGKPILIGEGEDGNVVMPNGRSFDVVYTDLSAKECVDAATYRFEQPEELGLLRVTIAGGGESRVFEWGAKDFGLPISHVEAERFCSNGAKVLWTFE